MKALIIYDSIFGNTEKIARAIGNGLASDETVEVVPVSSIKPGQLEGLDLLIVGSPTRGFRPTPAIADFLKVLPNNALIGVSVAAFDTRMAASDIGPAPLRFMVNIGGYAAKPIANLLVRLGGTMILAPEGFFVNDKEGPLKDCELDRAAAWAHQIYRYQKTA